MLAPHSRAEEGVGCLDNRLKKAQSIILVSFCPPFFADTCRASKRDVTATAAAKIGVFTRVLHSHQYCAKLELMSLKSMSTAVI